MRFVDENSDGRVYTVAALCHKYDNYEVGADLAKGITRAAYEKVVENLLAAEMRSAGWTVYQQVHCLSMNDKRRVADIYAQRLVADNEHAEPRMFSIAVEVKLDGGQSASVDAYEQCRRYRAAWSWVAEPDSEYPVYLPPPDLLCITSPRLLGSGWCNSSGPGTRTHLWRIGASYLWRDYEGQLAVSQRRLGVQAYKGGWRTQQVDRTLKLTTWNTKRHGGGR